MVIRADHLQQLYERSQKQLARLRDYLRAVQGALRDNGVDTQSIDEVLDEVSEPEPQEEVRALKHKSDRLENALRRIRKTEGCSKEVSKYIDRVLADHRGAVYKGDTSF